MVALKTLSMWSPVTAATGISCSRPCQRSRRGGHNDAPESKNSGCRNPSGCWGSGGKSLMSGLHQFCLSPLGRFRHSCVTVCFCVLGVLGMGARASSSLANTLLLSHTLSPVGFFLLLFLFPEHRKDALEPYTRRGLSKGRIQIGKSSTKWKRESGEGCDYSPMNLPSEWLTAQEAAEARCGSQQLMSFF